MSAEAAWLILLLPMSAAGLLLLTGRHLDRWAGPVGIAQSGLGCGLSGWAWVARPTVAADWLATPSRELALSLSAEGPAGALGFAVAAVVLAVTVYAHGFLGRDEARARFFGFFALFAAGMQAVVLAGDLILLLFGWELVGACSFALIAFWHRDAERVVAARRAFAATRSADLGLYVAAMAALGMAGTTALAALPEMAAPWRPVVAAGLVVAAAGKSAQLPFSGWLRGAMEGPTPVSALLHSATMVAAGVILLIKSAPVLEAVAWAGPLVLAVGIGTAVVGALVALVDTDIKRVLAASTVSQHGFMFAAVGAAGTAAAGTYLVNHAAFKALLFMAAGVLVARHIKALPVDARLRRSLPRTAALFLAGTLGLAAVPPAGGFLAKEAVLVSVKAATAGGWLVLLAVSVLTAAYAARLYLLAFEAPDRSGADAGAGRDAHGAMLLPAAALAAAVVVLALLPLPPFEHGWSAALAAGELPPIHASGIAASLGVVAAGVAAAFGLRQWGRLLAPPLPGRRAMAGWLGLEAGLDAVGAAAGYLGRALDRLDRSAPAEALARGAGHLGRTLDRLDRLAPAETLARGVGQLARAVAAADREATDRALVRLPAFGTEALAGAVRLADRVVWDGAIRRLDAALHAAARALSRLQGGLLHRYYAMTAVGVAALMVATGLFFRW